MVAEVLALAADGEDAYALLLEADFITESHRVHDALWGALAAAAETARALDELP